MPRRAIAAAGGSARITHAFAAAVKQQSLCRHSGVGTRRTPLHNGALRLSEFPVQALSKTWFGTPDDPRGLLCLALHSRARLTVDGLGPVDPARAICTMQLNNASPGILEYRMLALLTDHLGISRGGDGRLWATTVEVTFKGVDTDTDTGIRYLGGQVVNNRRLTPLTEPRNPVTESLSSRLLGGWIR